MMHPYFPTTGFDGFALHLCSRTDCDNPFGRGVFYNTIDIFVFAEWNYASGP